MTTQAVEPEIVDGARLGKGGELVSLGYALVQAENDALRRISIEKPRRPEEALQEALGEFSMLEKHLGAEFTQEYAKKGYYSIPYNDGEGGTTFVEGLSVRSQERLMRIWGNCAVTGRLTNEDERGYDVGGVAIDFQSGFRLERVVRVSKYAWRRKSRTTVLLSEPDQAKAVQIGVSKAIRNAGLAILPDWLRMIYFRRLKEMAAGDLLKPADPARATALITRFAEFKVTLEMLEQKLGKVRAKWTGDDLGTLIGLGSAIRDKEVTIEECFPGLAPPTAPGEKVVTPDSILAGQATGKDDAQETVKEPPPAPVTDKEISEAAALFDFE